MEQNGYDNLGFYSLSVIYLMFMLGSFFNTPVVDRLGAKYSMFWGGLCYLLWILCSLFPALKAEVYTESDLFIF